MSQEIKLTEKDYKYLQEGWMSKALKTEGEVMSEYANRERELLYKYVDYTYKILASLGIFAGFGFTGITRVQTLGFFILGEAILVATILYGLYWLKIYFESNLKPIQESSREIFKKYKARDRVFLEISKDFIERQIMKKDNLLDVQKKDQEILEWIGEHTGENSEKKETPPHLIMVLCAGFGLAIIFISFLI